MTSRRLAGALSALAWRRVLTVEAAAIVDVGCRIRIRTALGGATASHIVLIGRRFSSSLPPYTTLPMPALSPTMSSGGIASWSVEEGQQVSAGDALAEIETDKATMTWENQEDGYVAKILLPAGSRDVAVGRPVLVVVEDESSVGAFKDYQAEEEPAAGPARLEKRPNEAAAPGAPPPSKSGAPSPRSPQASSSGPHSRMLGPAARLLLRQHGLSARDVPATGPHDVLTKADVLAFVSSGKKPAQSRASPRASSAAPGGAEQRQTPSPPRRRGRAASGGHSDVPHTQMRRVIAARLCESKATVPHAYARASVRMGAAEALRASLKARGVRVSINDCIVKAAAAALRAVPRARERWDAREGAPAAHEGVDVSVAVATPGGLITPIVRSADVKSVAAIGEEVRELAARARENKLRPEEFQGGAFSVSNLGMFGVDAFFAIVNPPQSAILAVGASRQVAVVRDGRPAAESVLDVSLSVDQRVYDADVVRDFMAAFKQAIEDPLGLLV